MSTEHLWNTPVAASAVRGLGRLLAAAWGIIAPGRAGRWPWGLVLLASFGAVIASGVEFGIPEERGLPQVRPYALSIIVLVAAVRYAGPAYWIAGGLAAATYGLLIWTRAQASPDTFLEYDLVQPFLLLAGSVVLGEVVRAPRRRSSRAEQKYQHVTEALQELCGRYLVTLDAKAELEKRIVGESASVAALYDAAKRLETLNAAELYPATLDLIVKFLGAQACAVYVEHDGQLRLTVARPESWPGRPDGLSPDTGLAGSAVREREVVTVRDRVLQAGPAVLAREAVLMAGPLLGRDRRVLGVVVVEQLPYVKFTPASIRMFGLILDWVSAVLQNALLYEETRRRNIEDELTGLYTAAYATKRLRDELLRAHRYWLPLSVVVARIDDFEAVGSEVLQKLLPVLGFTFLRCLRAVDFVGRLPDSDKFVVVLPGTRIEGARVVVRRIEEDLQAYGLRPHADQRLLSVSFGVAAFSPELAEIEACCARREPDELLPQALADLEQAGPAQAQPALWSQSREFVILKAADGGGQRNGHGRNGHDRNGHGGPAGVKTLQSPCRHRSAGLTGPGSADP